jgi:prepilin-type N-terminal cleavage/methylation domain-containing protein
MARDNKGYSLIEILIAVALLGLVMALSGQLLQNMVTGQKKEAVVVTNQFEASLGVEMLRNDLTNAGFGLADDFKSSPGTYTEASVDPAMQFNNAPNVPKAIQHANNVSAAGYIANSDYLIIRSPAVGMSSTAGKWTNITTTKAHYWNDINLDMTTNDYMIVIKPRITTGGNSTLIVSGGVYAIKYPGQAVDLPTAFQPDPSAGERFLAFGIGTTAPTMPFVRADYYVGVPATANPNCAPGTGTLFKNVIGDASSPYPLIDCVANMQVVFNLDTNLDGIPDLLTNDIAGLDPYTTKTQIKEVQIYILAHEGIKEKGTRTQYTVPSVILGPSATLGTTVDLSSLDTSTTTAWKSYRWITYRLNVKPKSFY